MILEDALAYTHKAGYVLPSGGYIYVFRTVVKCEITLRRGAAGESEWHFANTAADAAVTIAMQGIHIPADAWEYRPYAADTTAPYHADREAIRDALDAGTVPPFFAKLLDDQTHAGIERVKECAAIIRSGAVAACMQVAL